MKRIGAILGLAVMLVMLTTSLCFAGTLTLENSNPKDGSKGASIENLGVKLYFNNTMTAEKVEKQNENAFQLYDPDGKKLPTRVLYSTTEEGVVLVLLDNTDESNKVTIEGNSTYTLKVSADVVDDAGNTLGTDQTVTFTTLNQKVNTMVNMLLMVVMFGGITIISTRSAKKAAEEQKNRNDDKVNPYKEAKRTGKSVEEIVEKDQKQKAKKAAKEARKAAKEDDDEEYYDDGNYHVKGPRPISAGGSSYITGRKALAEQRKAELERRQNAKKSGGKGKKK